MVNQIDTHELVDIFVSLERARTRSDKLDYLLKAKLYIINKMKKQDIREFFASEPSNFEQLFLLDVWTKHLDGDHVEFVEPYDIIERVFESFDHLHQLVDLFHKQIIYLLEQDKDEKCKHICVKHMIRLSKELDKLSMNLDPVSLINLRNMLESNIKDIMPYFIRQIPINVVSYSQLVNDLLCSLTIELNRIEAFVQSKDQRVDIFTNSIFENNQPLINEFERVYKLDSVHSLRIFEILVNLSLISEEHLKSICESKFNFNYKINSFLMNKTDVLSKLNCIELLTKLVQVNHGYNYLHKNQHLNHLLKLLIKPDEDAFSSIIIPSVVKMFSHIAHDRPKDVYENYSFYFDYLFKHAMDEDLINNVLSINQSLETFAYLFDANEIKKFVNENYRENFSKLLDRLTYIMEFVINENLKVATLKCIAELLAPDSSLLKSFHSDIKFLDSVWLTSEWSDLAKEFYVILTRKIGHEKFFSLVLKYARQPIVNLRLTAQLYFKAMSQTKWGINLIYEPNNFNGYETFFAGYILNRSIELEKEGLESKYEMVKLMLANLNHNNDLIYLIGEDGMNQLRQYIKDGPFYLKAQLNVAFEST
jgi:hypothetical protein